ncbi:TadE/TadG family type IV pilus assembly protein [Pelagibius sp. CAU 1746]|uniref:TadE/TadG family type IV pilus assembly protein n=1 Tax=Pelagibius sp. CAU 1746 TaxID=3140370 RepID=UPI00325AD42D
MFELAMVVRVGLACLTRIACGLREREITSSVWRRLRPTFGPLLRDERGNALIEFAFVAPPFLLLLIGTLEVSVMFFTSAVIEGATKEAARQIRTGNIQATADPLAAFRGQLCDSLFGVIDCNQVVFNVRTFSSFAAVSMPIELDQDGEIVNTAFTPGGSSEVTVVRAMYRWRFMTPLIDRVMPSGLAGHLLISTAAFQNEPYNVN